MTRSSRFPIWIALLISAMVSHAEDALPTGLLEPCQRKLPNREKLDKALEGKVAQGCRDQIQAAKEKCLDNQAMTDDELTGIRTQMEGSATNGLKGNVETARGGYLEGQTKHAKHAELCGDQMLQVDRICKEMEDGIKTALRNNTDHETSLQLQDDLKQNVIAATAAHQALLDQGQCSSNQSKIYADSVAKADRIIASTSDSSEANKENKKTDAYGRKVTDTATGSAQGFAQKKAVGLVAGKLESTGVAWAGVAAKAVTKAPGVIGVGGSLIQGDVPGLALKGTQSAVTYFAPSIAGAAAAPFAAVPLVMYSTPAGTCSERYVDPVQAYRSKCSVSTMQGASYNESAITAMSQK